MAPATSLSLLKDILSIVGGIGVLLGTAFGIWLALRKRAEHRQDRRQHEDETYRTRLTTLESLQTTDTEFRRDIQQRVNGLTEDVNKVRARCTQHQQQQLLGEMKDEMRRLVDKLDKIVEDFMRYKDLSTERFLSQKVHYSDLDLLQSAIDSLRQNVSEVSSTLAKVLTKSR